MQVYHRLIAEGHKISGLLRHHFDDIGMRAEALIAHGDVVIVIKDGCHNRVMLIAHVERDGGDAGTGLDVRVPINDDARHRHHLLQGISEQLLLFIVQQLHADTVEDFNGCGQTDGAGNVRGAGLFAVGELVRDAVMINKDPGNHAAAHLHRIGLPQVIEARHHHSR